MSVFVVYAEKKDERRVTGIGENIQMRKEEKGNLVILYNTWIFLSEKHLSKSHLGILWQFILIQLMEGEIASRPKCKVSIVAMKK